MGRNSKGHLCPVLKCPRCSDGHNIQLCPQEDQDQALVGAEADGNSEDEGEIKAWLDNREWPDILELACKENEEESNTNVHTLRDIYDHERILTLMEPSTLQSKDPDEDSDEGPTAPLTLTSPMPEEEDLLQLTCLNTSGNRVRKASGSSCSTKSIEKELEELKGRCPKLEIQERTERGIFEKQLESAIKDRREAENKYEDLLKEMGIPSEHLQEVPSDADPAEVGEEAD